MRKLFATLMLVLAALVVPCTARATALTDYTENLAVDNLLRGQTFSPTTPANYYVALYTSACNDTGPGTEVSGGSYARVIIARALTAWNGTHGSVTGVSSGSSGTVSNANQILFPTATADWGIVSYWGLIDSASGAGNLIICAPITTARNITNGATPSFASTALTVQIDN